ncbi:MAG: LysM peptidoglycan-binding domain-containing protein [Clostridiales bacterium]|nr:LysM peptidoglycan-binding domain-containing protein [Clostridiales bacterium]
MEIYLTDLETGDRMRFPMTPQSVNVKTGAIFQNYTVMAIGDIKLATGQELTGFQWEGMLPGEARKNEPYILEWRSPLEIQSQWSAFRAEKKKLRLMITETPVNHDVYLERYTVDYMHGFGDYYYNISFIEAKDLKVYVSGAGGDSSSTADTAANKPLGPERPTPPEASTHTVASGDSLWRIAEKLMGDGSKYPELYEANKELIGSNPSLIMPGQVLTIPPY